MQKVMILTTYEPDLRSAVDGVMTEDGDQVRRAFRERKDKYNTYFDVPVGLIASGQLFGFPPTVLHALGDGWNLLGPPIEDRFYLGKAVMYRWYLVRNDQR